MKKLLIGAIILASLSLGGCMSWTSTVKNITASIGGLEREVTVYDYNGNILEQWTGDILVEGTGERTKLTFKNKKTHIIDGGIIVIKEL